MVFYFNCNHILVVGVIHLDQITFLHISVLCRTPVYSETTCIMCVGSQHDRLFFNGGLNSTLLFLYMAFGFMLLKTTLKQDATEKNKLKDPLKCIGRAVIMLYRY